MLVHGFDTGHRALLDDHAISPTCIANRRHGDQLPRQPQLGLPGPAAAGTPTAAALAFVVINLVTMLLPIGCLWISRNVLGLDDPFSDNISANVIGLFLGLVARFYLFRHLRVPPAGAPAAPVAARTDPRDGPCRDAGDAGDPRTDEAVSGRPEVGPRVAQLGRPGP